MLSGQRPHSLGDQKSFCTRSCVLWFVTTFVWKTIFVQCIFKALRIKTELCSQGRGHTRGPILLICNTDQDFYHIRSHTKFGWASSIIFWLMVSTDRQTCQKWFFWNQYASKSVFSSKSRDQFFGPVQYFLYTPYSRESKKILKDYKFFRESDKRNQVCILLKRDVLWNILLSCNIAPVFL